MHVWSVSRATGVVLIRPFLFFHTFYLGVNGFYFGLVRTRRAIDFFT